jgi:hypothetical protein
MRNGQAFSTSELYVTQQIVVALEAIEQLPGEIWASRNKSESATRDNIEIPVADFQSIKQDIY